MRTILKKKVTIFFFLVFILLLPAALNINYQQNDEWIYYINIENFLKGDFKLLPLIAASFYGAGLPAVVFAKLFGIQRIPVLTLLISISSAYLLAVILNKHFKRNALESILFSCLFMFNPLFIYLAWGFMTDNYAVFYMLLSFYFFLKNQNEAENENIFLAVLFSFLAFLTRQIYIVVPLSYCIYFLSKRSYRKSMIHFGVFIAYILFYVLLFPKTSEMLSSDDIKFGNLTYFRYTFSFIYIILIYLVSLMVPIFITFLKENLPLKCYAAFIFFLIPLTVVANNYFEPSIIARDNYYYLINTVQRKGFLVDNVHGNKPSFHGFSIAYTLLNTSAVLLVAIVVTMLIVRGKNKLTQFPAIFLILYIFILTTSSFIHDRYLVPLFAVFILILMPYIKKPLDRFDYVILTTFVIFLAFYSYNFSADYIISNNYIWKRSQNLVRSTGVNAGEIVGTIAWNIKFPSKQKGFLYKFTYDNPSTQDYGTNYELIEIFKISFPGSFWKQNNIYLYKKL